MSVPIVELITANLVETLSGVSETAGGYSTTLTVSEPDAVADAVADGTCIVNEGDWSYEDNPPYGMDGVYQTYEIVVYVRGGDERNHQRLGRQYANDVKRAVMSDETRGGYARWSKVTAVRNFSDGALRGVTVDYQVYFWHLKDRPDAQS